MNVHMHSTQSCKVKNMKGRSKKGSIFIPVLAFYDMVSDVSILLVGGVKRCDVTP